MRHHNQASPKYLLFVKDFIESLETAGKKVFPGHFSSLHFDNKLSQKYLHEATGFHHVTTYAFFIMAEAIRWAEIATFPKVFKLRRVDGSRNVWLASSNDEAVKLIKKAFGRSFRQYDAWGGIKQSIRKMKLGKVGFKNLVTAVVYIIYPIQLERSQGRERGYVYFQDFIPDNKFEIRVIVIGDKAFAIKRHVRNNDFCASGSGIIEYKKELFDDSLVDLSFKNATALNAECAAYDYVFLKGKPLVVEQLWI